MHIEVTIVQPENYIHSLAFTEIMESLAYGFHTLGHHVELTRNHVATALPTVILGANLLSAEVIHNLPYTAILYNLEQITENSPWITPKWMDSLRNKVIWDYSPRNIEFWKSRGFMAQYVPVGYVPTLTRINRIGPKDIDVVFYGSLNQRRIKILEALKKYNLNVVALSGVYGQSRDAVIARSKLAINIHFYVPNIFEVVRASYLIANRVPLLSERNADTYVLPEWEPLADWAVYDQLIQKCFELLTHSELQDTADSRLEIFRNYPFIEYLEMAIRSTV
ncbi:hypothetical protein [Sulfobacillus thermosulfidooxidans]|uniref:hypothetical protein n=1 Tax=Sulfobacillus thermosulfidooxidans TaxID=28034 RepID=UPI00096B7DCC|nr:hypothetical protein [Sulfobacillus thermosulfidooxidans]OLZ11739.1 hypothetical protein BFX05_07040 [Sulfobacillus thermosulfidooxidans]OLZ18702.1 hypothetical protein BFX06_00635 [Sulfobacillus thermosulfidooxidans]OLZ20219.1 hypothetical protein BFX07_01165 [Sulfobacillus thermosulfidooxidans]